MVKSFYSDTAKQLARQNGIKLEDIHVHRDDQKATVDNVKCAILKRHTSGVMVSLLVRPRGFKLTNKNMQLLKSWFSKHSKSAEYVVDVSDIKVFVVPGPEKTSLLRITYRLHDTNPEEVRFSSGFIVDPDDDYNYPVYVKNGNITSIDRYRPNGGESRNVVGEILKTEVTPLGQNNFGSGMIGNPTPFKRR